LIKAIALNENSDFEIQDKLDLEISTDADLEEAPLRFGDDEGVPDVDEDGRVNEDIEWDIYILKDDTGTPCQHDLRNTEKILKSLPNIDVEESLNLYLELGGFCDCEILFNVEEGWKKN
jgi:hypothetical protein